MKRVVKRAYDFAKAAHGDQLDDSCSNYFEAHVVNVYEILLCVTDDEEILAAGLLHDVVEDTDIDEHEILKNFGPRIYSLVMEVTHEGRKDEVGYYFPRLHSESGILIKFADRLSNLSRMQCWGEKRRLHYLKRSKFWKSFPDG